MVQDVIRLLPDSLANQIAAGEVVQRPASVVKELLENAVDAQSSRIELVVKNSGKTLIQVTDNGIGMTETDARMCFERHATSKITSVEDLFAIRTKGFRGEAMASIAAVAQVELKTKIEADDLGTRLQIEGSKVIAQEPIQTPKGTTIAVKNLFFNVPARRNFLKSDSVELRHIYDEFHRVALAHPKIEFVLYQNDIEVYQLKKGKLAQRIVGIFGKNYKERLIPCSEEVSDIQVKGYISKPEFAKKTRGEQFFFVNNRFIKHSYLNHAVITAYEGLLQENTFPLYILFIQIDPKGIDVNVHPTKTEVKFEDERTAYAVIHAAIKQALGTHHLYPTLDFDYDVNFVTGQSPKLRQSENDKNVRNYNKMSDLELSNLDNWEKLYEESIPNLADDYPEHSDEISDINTESAILTFESAANQVEENLPVSSTEKELTTFQLHYQYIISRVKSGILLIRQQAAHQRILYERFITQLQNQKGTSQQLLFPQRVAFNTIDLTILSDLEAELKALGFVYEIEGKNVSLKGIPADLLSENTQLLEGLIEQYKTHKSELRISKHENIAIGMAKQGAIRAGTALNQTEMQLIINQLFACQNPNYSPEGERTFAILDEEKLMSLFL